MLVYQKPCLIVIIACSHFVKVHFCIIIMGSKSLKDSQVLKMPVQGQRLASS